MPLHPGLTPPRPPRLITAKQARAMELWVACGECSAGRYADATALPAAPITIGELWLAGRFRCRTCGKPAAAVMVIDKVGAAVQRERWALGEAGLVDRLKAAWRED